MNFHFITRLLFLFLSLSIFAQEDIYSAHTIPEELTKNANAVIRHNDVVYSLKKRNLMSITESRVVTVLNKKGNRHVQAYAGFDKHNKIKKIEAIIYDGNGKEIKKIRKKDFIDQSAVDGGTLYSDSRVLYMSYMPTTYPYTVSFVCETETPNTVFVPSWRPISAYYVSIERDSYKLNDLANLGIKNKVRNFDGFNIESEKTNSSLLYAIKNIPAIKPEQLSPSLYSLMPHVMVAVQKFNYYGIDGEANSWKEFGDWMLTDLLEGRNNVSEATANEILDLVKGVDDPLERAKMVYEYVQKNTRYISVQVGIGGNQPIAAIEVDRLKYGDCKGLTNYTQALMEVAGVTSYYSVVEAGREIVDFDPDFPSMEQGNHIILAIQNDEDLVWVDCTTQVHPFGFVGDFTDNRNVLLVKKEDSKIVKTPLYVNKDNIQNTKADIKLLADGSFYSDIEIKTKGTQYDSRFRLEDQSQKDIKDYYKNYWDYMSNLVVKTYKFNNNKSDVEFTENIELAGDKYATINNEGIIFKPNFFNKNTFIPDRYRNRKYPLNIDRGYLDVDSFNIAIPKDYVVDGIPENISLESKFGKYEVTFSVEENNIKYTRELSINRGVYSKEDYEAYRKFRRSVAKYDNSIIVLKNQN